MLVLLAHAGAALMVDPLDSSCGAPPLPLNASTANVLVIGDSISMGFGVSDTDAGFGYGRPPQIL